VLATNRRPTKSASAVASQGLLLATNAAAPVRFGFGLVIDVAAPLDMPDRTLATNPHHLVTARHLRRRAYDVGNHNTGRRGGAGSLVRVGTRMCAMATTELQHHTDQPATQIAHDPPSWRE
jgi:hypothetical protein